MPRKYEADPSVKIPVLFLIIIKFKLKLASLINIILNTQCIFTYVTIYFKKTVLIFKLSKKSINFHYNMS